eukprot:CAMPEP_0118984854 /NCGR_PEP_ID=MMETSP1173-20130426/38639_1 /TAXON_ID=1034831 /ORGANISM="Rhizochromulina marina cf, Strain CCMP1243" /LENGTH=58 /DNA_ID=CAMNT_0006935535 /DNA_START=21 /DNA_END=194 /DNA_ORIENTATION=+
MRHRGTTCMLVAGLASAFAFRQLHPPAADASRLSHSRWALRGGAGSDDRPGYILVTGG